MDNRPKTRRVNRERNTGTPQPPRGAKQIVIPMTRPQYDEIWHDPERTRAFVDRWVRSAPELFPAGFDRGYRLHGFGRESRKLPGLKLRKVVTADGSSYWLRPSFVTGYMTGTVDELAYPLLLAAHGVPPWLLKIGFGHSEMYWYRVVERLGRSSLVGATVRDPARLPAHLAADEHHADWAGRKGYVATTVGGGCILGVALTAAADDVHLQEAYGVFAAEARDVDPGYAPETVNTDGWAATRNAFAALFPADRGDPLLPARVPQGPRPLPQGPRPASPDLGCLPRRHRRGVPPPDGRASAMVCHPDLDRAGARDGGEAVGQDGVLRGGL